MELKRRHAIEDEKNHKNKIKHKTEEDEEDTGMNGASAVDVEGEFIAQCAEALAMVRACTVPFS